MPGYEDIVLGEIYRQGEQRAQAMAAQMGKPPSTGDLNDEREIREWLRDDPSIDVDALRGAGKTIEEITRAKHPNRVRLIETHSPDWTKRCDYAEKLARRAAEWQDRQREAAPVLSELDAMGPEPMGMDEVMPS